MVRTPACHAGGREFESRPSRHFKSRKFKRLRLFCFHVSRQTQYPRGSRGCDAAQSQYLSHLRRNARPPENHQNWRFVGSFFGSTPKRVDFNERRRIEPRPSICNFGSFDNRKPFVVSVSFSCGSPRLFRYFS